MAGIVYESYYGISGLGSPYLMHHGIKGQRWGIRRWQNADGSLTTAGREHYKKNAKDNEKKVDISEIDNPFDSKQVAAYYNFKEYDAPLEKIQADRDRELAEWKSIKNEIVNAKYDGNPAVKKAVDKTLKDYGYYDDPEDSTASLIISEYKENGKSSTMLDNFVFWNYANDVHPEYVEFSKRVNKDYYDTVKKVGSSILNVKGSAIFDKQVDGVNKETESINNGKRFAYNTIEENEGLMRVYLHEYMETLKHSGDDYLMHYGVKNMKWYQRRYQNEDGSLTALGRLHYGIGKGRKEAGAKEKVAAYDAKRKEERAARKKEKIIKSGSAKVVARNSDKLNDEELQQAINRINLMTKVNDLKPPKEPIVKSITTKLETMNKLMTAISNVKTTGEKLKEQFRDPEEKAEEERQKALQKLVDEKRGDDFRRKLADVIKNARENTEGSDADVERAVKLASDEFVKNYRDAETGKDKDYSSFKERLAKQKERQQEKEWAASKKKAESEVKQGLKNKRDFQNELAKLREKAEKAQAAKEKAQAAKEKAGQNEKNESWISKLSSVADQHDAERNGPRDSQEAYNRLKSIGNDIRIDRINREATPAVKSFISSIDSYKAPTPQPSLSDAREASSRLSAINSAKRQQAASESFNSTYRSISSLASSGKSAMNSGKSVVQSLFKAATSTPKVSSITSPTSSKTASTIEEGKSYNDALLKRMEEGTKEWEKINK